MINSIKLQGFQSHDNSIIEFSNGVNILIGQSRNGKTSVLRAFRWLLENRPLGIDNFIMHNKKEISVTLELDGHTITRKKNSKENVYILDGEVFAGIGSNVPEPITQILNLADLNISNQFDQPYLLFDSPGQVAQQLNSVVHLEKIDTALANISSLKRANDQDIRVQEARVKELEALEASFPDLEAAEEHIAGLEKQQRERREKEQKKGFLLAIQNDLAKIRIGLAKVQLPEGVEHRVIDLGLKHDHKAQLKYTKDLLLGIQTKLAQARLEMARIEPALRQDTFLAGLIVKNQSLKNKNEILIKLNMYQNHLDLAHANLLAKNAIIETDEEKFQKMIGNTCPLCDQPIRAVKRL